jgi:hypothetical protein
VNGQRCGGERWAKDGSRAARRHRSTLWTPRPARSGAAPELALERSDSWFDSTWQNVSRTAGKYDRGGNDHHEDQSAERGKRSSMPGTQHGERDQAAARKNERDGCIGSECT